MASSNHRTRIRIIAGGIFLGALVLVARLFFIQIVKGEAYTEEADRQYAHPASRLFNRGSIFFSQQDNTTVLAASVANGFTLSINPSALQNKEEVFTKLNAITPLEHENLITRASKPNDPHEEIAARLDQNVADQITKLDLPGVLVEKDRWRSYPAGTMASHVVGLLGYKGNDLAGRYGIEQQYENVLKRLGDETFAGFFANLFSGLGQAAVGAASQDEGDVVLTLEPTAQKHLEEELAGIIDKWHSDSAGGIIMDPKTGAIVAMAGTPAFDPGAKQTDLNVLKNPLVENSYEMGSIVKALTMASALDAGVVTASTTYHDAGVLAMNGFKIYNYDHKSHGVPSMQEVLNHSLNTGAVFAMQQLGRNRFRDYFRGFGLGEKTNIDLPDEATGIVNNLSSTRDVEYANISFGQGIAMSPIDITRALAALGNGGVLVRPHVTKEIRYKTRPTYVVEPVVERRVLKPETSTEITRMLVTVVDTSLLNGTVKQAHYSIAAKTGTAQIPSPDGGYYPDRYFHTFFGYFPAYNPKFIIFLYNRYPKNVQYASETLTVPFMNIAKFLINYYDLPPDR